MGNFGHITKQVEWKHKKFSFKEPAPRKTEKQLVRVLTTDEIDDLGAVAKATLTRFFQPLTTQDSGVKND